jgi:hypothetical protein
MTSAATQPSWLSVLTGILLGVTALASGGFVYRYWRRYKWWKTDIGRDLITFSSCLALFCAYGAVAVVWPDIPGRALVRAAVIVVIATLSALRFVMFESFVGGRSRKQLPRQKVNEDQTNQ